MQSESGMSLVELLMVLGIVAVVLAVTVAATIPMLARESMRGAIYDVQTYMQSARTLAVSRNRPCRMVVNTTARELQVLDGMGTASVVDDEVIYRKGMPTAVSFARPDTGAAVTLNSLGGGVFDITFNGDGTVSAGTGMVCLFGGDHFRRTSVFAAGGVQVEHWGGSAWQAGS